MKKKYYSQDITFCMNKCNRKTCKRNKCNISNPYIPHSFSYFKDTQYCPYGKMKQPKTITIEIPKIQADCLLDFLECEFINGIGGKEDMQNNGYVKNIKAVYDKLQEACKDA